MANEEEPADEILRRNPQFRNLISGYGGKWMSTPGGVVNIYGNIDSSEAEKIGAQNTVTQVQFAQKFEVTVTTLRALNDHVFTNFPQARFRETLNGHGAFEDLSFIKHLPNLRSLTFAGNHAIDLQPIVMHGAIENLWVGGNGTSLSPLQGNDRLKFFSCHDKIKHHETIGTLSNVNKVSFVGQRLMSLVFLRRLPRLRSLSFFLGGTRNFEDLPTLENLKHFSVWRTRQLEAEHLLPLNRVHSLCHVTLRELPRITSLDWLTSPSVEIVELQGMKALHSYVSLASLPNLKTIILRYKVTASQIAELTKLSTLSELYVYQNLMEKALEGLDIRSLPFAVKPITFREEETPPTA